MAEAAHLRIVLDADGAASTVADIELVNAAMATMNEHANRTHHAFRVAAATISVFGRAVVIATEAIVAIGAAGAIANLIGIADGLVAIAGGAIGASAGLLAIGGGMAYVGYQALKAYTGAEDLKGIIEKLTADSTPLGKALDSLKDSTKGMGEEFFNFVQTIGPQFIGTFQEIIDISKKYMAPALDQLAQQTKTGLGIIVDYAREAAPHMLPFLKSVGDDFNRFLKSLTPLIAPSMKALSSAFSGLVTGLIAIIKPMKPFLVDIGRAFGTMFATLGQALGGIGKATGPSLKPFMDALSGILGSIGDFLKGAGPGLGQAGVGLARGLGAIFEALAPMGKQLSPFFALVGETLGKIGEALAPVLPVFLQLLKAVLEPLLPILPDIAEMFAEIVVALKPLIKPIGELIAALVPLIKEVLPLLTDGLVAVIKVATPVIKAIIEVLTAIIRFVTGAIRWVKNWRENLAKLPGQVAALLAKVVVWFSQLPGKIGRWLMAVIPKAVAAAKDWIAGIIRGLVQKVRDLWKWLSEFPSLVGRFFASAASWLYQAGRNILVGLWNGMKDFWTQEVVPFVLNIGPWIARNKGPASVDKRLLYDNGRYLMGGFHKGLKDEWENVQKTVSMMAPTLKANMGFHSSATVEYATSHAGAQRQQRLTGTLRITNWDHGVAFIDARVDGGEGAGNQFTRRRQRMVRK